MKRFCVSFEDAQAFRESLKCSFGLYETCEWVVFHLDWNENTKFKHTGTRTYCLENTIPIWSGKRWYLLFWWLLISRNILIMIEQRKNVLIKKMQCLVCWGFRHSSGWKKNTENSFTCCLQVVNDHVPLGRRFCLYFLCPGLLETSVLLSPMKQLNYSLSRPTIIWLSYLLPWELTMEKENTMTSK